MYRYLIEKETGRIAVRSTGSLAPGDADKQVIIESHQSFWPGTHLYDFGLRRFTKRPASELAIKRRNSGLARERERQTCRETAKEMLSLPDPFPRLFELLLTLPEDILLQEFMAEKEARNAEAPRE